MEKEDYIMLIRLLNKYKSYLDGDEYLLDMQLESIIDGLREDIKRNF